jgi:hypothetical protein
MKANIRGRKPRHPVTVAQWAQILGKCTRLEDSDRQSLRNNRLNCGHAVTHERQTPTAVVSVQRLGCPFPEETALRINRDRQGINVLDKGGGAACPDRLFTTQELAAAFSHRINRNDERTAPRRDARPAA